MGHPAEGEYRQDVEDEVHGRIAKRNPTEPLPIKALPDRKQGRPLLLGDELDTAVQAYVESIGIIGIVALPCALQLLSNCSIPDILVDVVASYVWRAV